MAVKPVSMSARGVHPIQLVLLAGALQLFLGGLLADLAYMRTFQIQWANFAAWLVAGGMVSTGLALAWSLYEAVRSFFRDRRGLLVLLLLVAMFLLGLLNSFIHARDAWGAMPSSLLLSIIVTALAFAATWISAASPRARAVT
jgi:uncharacterized membrane protein